jgi:hypothetical protein
MEILRTIVSESEILALICVFVVPTLGLTFYKSLRLYFRHRERIELIQQGGHPDFPDEDAEEIASQARSGGKKVASF